MDPTFLHVDSEDYDQTDLWFLMTQNRIVNFLMSRLYYVFFVYLIWFDT